MTSKEIVRRALRFERPARLPVRFDAFGCTDFGDLPVRGGVTHSPRQEGEDEWGCVWAQTEMKNMGQVKGHPIRDVREIDSYPYPRFDEDERYADAPEALDRLEAEGKYVTCGIFMVLFERMHALYGFENALMGLVLDRPAMEALADHVVAARLNLIENVARRFPGRLHGWGMTDDWGTQQAAFIGLDLWMDVFLPRYKRIFDAMHAMGCDVLVHSCGRVNEIIEGYIQAGVDVVNLQQPRALGIEAIGRRYRGRIAFEALCDIQQTLPTGDRAKIDADAEALMTHWASPDGGFIFSDYGDDEAIGVPDVGAKLHMYRAFSRHSEKLYGQPLPEPQLPEAAHA